MSETTVMVRTGVAIFFTVGRLDNEGVQKTQLADGSRQDLPNDTLCDIAILPRCRDFWPGREKIFNP